jgi:methylase of polypeptide subunit release factors
MADLTAVKAHQLMTLERLRQRHQPEMFPFAGVEIEVSPEVFPPIATDTQLLLAHLPLDMAGWRVLELTTGSGALSVVCGLRGASGIACDLNPAAVKDAARNFARHRLDFQALHSDGFTAVPPERFDLLLMNPPYLHGEPRDRLEGAFVGSSPLVARLFQEGSAYLRPAGQALVTWAEWQDPDRYLAQAQAGGWQGKLVGRLRSEDDQRSYRLDRWRPREA